MTGDARPDPPRLQMAEMTPGEAAKFIRNLAEVCAGSSSMDNFEAIVETMIVSAMEAGRKFGRKESGLDPSPRAPEGE